MAAFGILPVSFLAMLTILSLGLFAFHGMNANLLEFAIAWAVLLGSGFAISFGWSLIRGKSLKLEMFMVTTLTIAGILMIVGVFGGAFFIYAFFIWF